MPSPVFVVETPEHTEPEQLLRDQFRFSIARATISILLDPRLDYPSLVATRAGGVVPVERLRSKTNYGKSRMAHLQFRPKTPFFLQPASKLRQWLLRKYQLAQKFWVRDDGVIVTRFEFFILGSVFITDTEEFDTSGLSQGQTIEFIEAIEAVY